MGCKHARIETLFIGHYLFSDIAMLVKCFLVMPYQVNFKMRP